jgi:hypothetical protein
MAQEPVARRQVHHRSIDMRGYERSDGLFEVEGRVVDRKSDPFVGWLGGRDVAAGEPIHDMGVRIVFDRQMTVIDIETFTDAAPYAICPGGGLALQALKGLKMSSGWSRRVRERLATAQTCTHLMQILMPMATVAFQTLSPVRRAGELPRDATGRPLKVDSCHAYGAHNTLVRDHWPEYYRPAPPSGEALPDG